MANFVRDGIALEVPEAQLSLLKTCFDKADNELLRLKDKLDALSTVTLKGKKYLADSQVVTALEETEAKIEALTNQVQVKDMDVATKEQELLALRAEVEKLLAQEEALKMEIEKLKEVSSEDAMYKKLSDRRQLERVVFPLLDSPEAELITKSDRELKELLISKRYNRTADSLASKSDDAINAMFEIASAESLKDVADKKMQLPQPAVQLDSASVLGDVYKSHVQETESAWKTIINK